MVGVREALIVDKMTYIWEGRSRRLLGNHDKVLKDLGAVVGRDCIVSGDKTVSSAFHDIVDDT